MAIRFGPAGLGPIKGAEGNLEEFARLGLKGCEISFTHSIYIKDEKDAERIGKKAKELGIELTIHGLYYVNLNSEDKEKIEATKKRLIECCRIGEKLGVTEVVFHPGFYRKNQDKEEAFRIIKEGVLEVMEEIKKKGWKIKISPETTGKVNVFGSVEEISRLVRETGCSFCIDFAHILAREKKVDYDKIEKLFPWKKWHVHFSGIIYGEKGERSHRKTETKEWKDLLKNLPKDRDILIINESPDMVVDSVEGKRLFEKS